jgi:glycosyltransferase involved in cell wall biosynthesis
MLCPYPNTKGPIPKIVRAIISGLQSLGCHVEIERWGRHSDTESLGRKIIGRLQDIARIWRTLHQQFDLVLVETAHDWFTLIRDIPLLLVTRYLCRSIVLQLHGSDPERLLQAGNTFFKQATSLLLRLSDAVLVLSSEEQRQWEQFYPEGKFFVVSNPFIPMALHTSTSPYSRQQFPNGVPVLLFVGRLIPEKGIYDILEAFARVKLQLPSHLLIVGSGPDTQRVKEEIIGLGIQDCVTLTGYLKGDQLIDAYQAADIFVLPTYWTEGFPMVIIEAMSFGLPIVTTRIRGAADHLLEDINACFVIPHDPVALSETLIRLLTDPIKCEKMSQTNLEKVKEFDPEKVGRHYFNLFEELVSLQ